MNNRIIKIKRHLLPLLVLFMSSIFVISCSQKEVSRENSANNLFQTAKVTRKNFSKTVMGYGYVKSIKKLDVVAFSRGQIKNIYVKNGEKVRKGQNLLSMRGYYSVRASEELGSASDKSGKDIVKIAPISGYVSNLNKSIGNAVDDGEILLSIVDLRNLIVEVTVFGDDANYIKTGQSAIVSKNNVRYVGSVSFVSAQVNPKTGGRKVGVKIVQKNDIKLLPGDFVKAEIVIIEDSSSLAVPQKALLTDGGKKIVMVKNGESYVKKNITIGLRDSEYVEILDGLKDGEEVVTTGAYELLNRGIAKKIKVED